MFRGTAFFTLTTTAKTEQEGAIVFELLKVPQVDVLGGVSSACEHQPVLDLAANTNQRILGVTEIWELGTRN